MTLLDPRTRVDPPSEPPRTHRPQPASDDRAPVRRRLHGTTADDRFAVLGAMAAAMAVSTLVFGWISPLTGIIGWFAVTFILFLAFYAAIVGMRGDRREVSDRVMTALMYGAGILLLTALVFVLVYTLVRGMPAMSNLNFFTQDMEFAGPLEPLSVGGVLHAIVGTLIQISIALIVTVPLGIATAVYLNEVGGRFARFVRTICDAMTALPSIVAGLFVYAAIILLITKERSGFAASIAISVMMLPIIVRASDVVLRLVAGNLREASYALGAGRWRTVWHVVLPTARSGLTTAVILGTARGIGETSPVLLTSGVTAVLNANPFSGPMISLPLQAFILVRSPEPTMIARGFGAAATLIVLVLFLFTLARILGGRPPGQLTARQRAARTRRSEADAMRIARRRPAESVTPVVPSPQESPS